MIVLINDIDCASPSSWLLMQYGDPAAVNVPLFLASCTPGKSVSDLLHIEPVNQRVECQ